MDGGPLAPETRSPMAMPPETFAVDTISLESSSEEATLALAEALGGALRPGDTIGLSGDLGAGKTVFVRGLARGCGVDPNVPVCSPTFTLANVYPAPTPLYHLDLYRLGDEDELEGIGYRDYTDGSGIVAVEWCDQVEGALPEDSLRVALAVVDIDRRTLRATAPGPRSRELLAVLRSVAATTPGVSTGLCPLPGSSVERKSGTEPRPPATPELP